MVTKMIDSLPAPLSVRVPVPANFHRQAFLDFQRRDPLELAERVVDGRVLNKGLDWNGAAACLKLQLGATEVEAQLQLSHPEPAAGSAALASMVRHMLGLTQDVEAFERQYRKHPQLGALIAGNPGLRVPVTATPFEALSWAVTGQQISVHAALSIRANLIRHAGLRCPDGLYCYPGPMRIAAMDEAQLQALGFSRAKSETLLRLSRLIADGQLVLSRTPDNDAIRVLGERLLAVKGIGPWTVNYTLLRGFGWLDGSLHGDVAVRRNLQRLLSLPDKPTAADAERWLAEFSPWRALVAAHLWALEAPGGQAY